MARPPPPCGEEGLELLVEFCVQGTARSAWHKKRHALREWQGRIAAKARSRTAAGMLDGPVELHLTEFSEVRTKDRDNFAKPIQDALQGVAFKDDRQILRLEVDWRDINGLYRVRYMSKAVAAALILGREFVWVRIYRYRQKETLIP